MVLSRNNAINQYLWLFFEDFHRAIPFQIKDHIITEASKSFLSSPDCENNKSLYMIYPKSFFLNKLKTKYSNAEIISELPNGK